MDTIIDSNPQSVDANVSKLIRAWDADRKAAKETEDERTRTEYAQAVLLYGAHTYEHRRPTIEIPWPTNVGAILGNLERILGVLPGGEESEDALAWREIRRVYDKMQPDPGSAGRSR